MVLLSYAFLEMLLWDLFCFPKRWETSFFEKSMFGDLKEIARSERKQNCWSVQIVKVALLGESTYSMQVTIIIWKY